MPTASILSLFDPFFLAHRALRAEISQMAARTQGVVLDVGCGAAPYRALFTRAVYFGFEIQTVSAYGSPKTADVLFDGKRLPVCDMSVDAVLCSQVLEHVFDARLFLLEINRILRPGGKLLLTVPFVWDEHEQPFDFARYSSFGLHHLADLAGFEVSYATRTLADTSLFTQLWLAYLHKTSRRLYPMIGKTLLAAAAFPLNLFGLASGKLLPRSPDLYLDNAMVWTKTAQPGRTG